MNAKADRPRISFVAHEAYWLRKLAYFGARYGSASFVKHGPVAIGALVSRVLPGFRRIVKQNLRRIHGRRSLWQEERDLTQTFIDYACCLSESLGFERIDPKDVVYRVVGRGALDDALLQATGFIVVTAHVGAWDSAAKHLYEETGRSVMVVMTRESNIASRRFHDSIRQRPGVEIAHVGKNAFEGLVLLKHLRAGGIIAVQLDRMSNASRSLQVRLFNQNFDVPQGPFRLASLAAVPIIPIFCARTGHFEYEIHVNSPIRLDRRPSVAQLREAAQCVTTALEEFLRRYPTQWFRFGVADPNPDLP